MDGKIICTYRDELEDRPWYVKLLYLLGVKRKIEFLVTPGAYQSMQKEAGNDDQVEW